ncbi:hypothetical protein ENUP19_0106G0017 [Entamoeba nuttalli]|uniref:Uncharacterized protein n=1 Tax=Entamoeba nuttalli TaxID=412467 RepID=A0ABQ0DHR0_9EUKA
MIGIILLLISFVAAVPNPAALNCLRVGMKPNTLHTKQGSMSVCETDDGQFVDAWKLLRTTRFKQGGIKLEFLSVDKEGNLVKGEEVTMDNLIHKNK